MPNNISRQKRASSALFNSISEVRYKLVLCTLTWGVSYISGGEAMADKIADFFTKYGFYGALIVILVIVLTALVKWPIKKAAVKWAVKKDLGEKGKKKITQWLSLVPFVFSFIFSLLLVLWQQCSWNIQVIDWYEVAGYCVTYGTAAIATFDVVKGFAEGFAARSNKATESVSSVEHEVVEEPEVVISDEEKEKAKAEEKAKKLADKEAKKAKKAAVVFAKKQKTIDDKIAKLNAAKQELAVPKVEAEPVVVKPQPVQQDEDLPENR